MGKRQLTAKERTVSMPGVDLREQNNRAHPLVVIAPVRLSRQMFFNAALAGTVRGPWSCHLVHLPEQKPVCGEIAGKPDFIEGYRGTCQKCLAEASRMRATVGR